MENIEVLGFNVEADPTPLTKRDVRRVHLIVRVKHQRETRLSPLRVPLEIQNLRTSWRKRVVAVGLIEETVSQGVADVDLPLGDYVVTCEGHDSMRTDFRLRSAPHLPISICSHSNAHPTEVTLLAEPKEGREEHLLGMQEMFVWECCQVHVPFWNASRKDLYELGIYYPLKNSLRLVVDGKEQIVHQGEYSIERPASRVELSSVQSWPIRFRHAFFPSYVLRRLREEWGLDKALGAFDFSSDPRPLSGGVAQALDLWESAYQQTPGYGRQELLGLASRWLFMRLLQEHPNNLARRKGLAASNHENPKLRIVRHVLERHFSESVNMKAIADEVGMSVRSVNRMFQSDLGLRPKVYLQQIRMEHAKRLIRDGKRSLSEIAVAVGYRDFRAFSRIFKQHTQGTPSSFRA